MSPAPDSDPTLLTVVDLGLGNLHSVARAVERAGAVPVLTSEAGEVAEAERILVPGQGAFASGAKAVQGEMGDALRGFLASGRPYLGICLGMQLLFETSEEAPGAQGLGWFKGEVRALVPSPERKVPHIGWNQVASDHPWMPSGGWFYFVHSYHCVPEDPAKVIGTVDYGGPICAAVGEGSVFACQFHPEKSQRRGEALLRHFLQDALGDEVDS